MNYTALFAAIDVEAKKRKLTIAQLDFYLGNGKRTIAEWIGRGKKPGRGNSFFILKNVIEKLSINIDDYAELETITDRIEYLLVKNGLNTNELGVSLSTISLMRTGKTIPCNRTLETIATITNTTPEWILHGDKPTSIKNGLVDSPKIDDYVNYYKKCEEIAKKVVESEPVIKSNDAIIKKQQEVIDANKKLIELEARQIELIKEVSNQSDIKTMSSIELVKIINDMREEGAAVLTHDNFMKKVVKVLGEVGAVKFNATYRDVQNKERPCYALPKREAHLMVMSESYKVQAAVYDKMVELEQKAIEPIQAHKPKLSISELNQQFKDARELAFNRGFQNGQASDKAVELLKQATGFDLDAIIGKPKHKMDVSKLSQMDLMS